MIWVLACLGVLQWLPGSILWLSLGSLKWKSGITCRLAKLSSRDPNQGNRRLWGCVTDHKAVMMAKSASCTNDLACDFNHVSMHWYEVYVAIYVKDWEPRNSFHLGRGRYHPTSDHSIPGAPTASQFNLCKSYVEEIGWWTHFSNESMLNRKDLWLG